MPLKHTAVQLFGFVVGKSCVRSLKKTLEVMQTDSEENGQKFSTKRRKNFAI